MPYESREDMQKRQQELQRQQRIRDGGNTFGNESKDPCRKEREMSLLCRETNIDNTNAACQSYINNYKSCLDFWKAVRDYRGSVKRQYDLPNDETRVLYKKQLKNWLKTKKIIDPDQFE